MCACLLGLLWGLDEVERRMVRSPAHMSARPESHAHVVRSVSQRVERWAQEGPCGVRVRGQRVCVRGDSVCARRQCVCMRGQRVCARV